MLNRTKKFLLVVLLAVFLLPLAVVAEEAEPDPNLPGDPECQQCHGLGKIEYGKKAGDTTLITYCYYKDAGKRCPVIIGGWEPCQACEDWPNMQPIFNEYERIVKGYRAEGAFYNDLFEKYQSPVRKLNFLCGKHVRVFSNAPHDRTHGLVVWAEKNLSLFSEDFDLGGEGSDWERMHTDQGKHNNIVLNSRDEYVKTIEWYYNSPHMPAMTKQIGLERLKGTGASGFLFGRMTSISEQGADQDERGIIKSYSNQMLDEAFRRTEGNKDPFAAWISEGIGNYYQEILRGSVTWYTIVYGQGTQRDRDTWGSFQNWYSAIGEANKVAKSTFDDRTGSWKGLIPMDSMLDFRMENIPAQGVVQSWAMVHYFMGSEQSSKKKRAEAKLEFKQFLTLVGSGVDQRQAFQEVYNVKNITSLESKFRLWLKKFAK